MTAARHGADSCSFGFVDRWHAGRTERRSTAGCFRRVVSALLVVQLVVLPGVESGAAPTDSSTLAMDRGLGGSPAPPSVSADPFTGAAGYTIPILLPPGPGGLTPELFLRYSSAGPRDSWVGAGWTLALPSISRSLKRGTPTYTSDDLFAFAGQELYPVQFEGGGLGYRTRRDNFMRVVRLADSWTVTQKDGTQLRFGTTGNSRIEGPLGTFEWLLDSVVDRNGNAYTVTYFRLEPGTAYPAEIRYGQRVTPTGEVVGSAGSDRVVAFDLEFRPDASGSYLAGFERRMNLRASRISVRAGGQAVRSYLLRYIESPDSFRSLLSEVEMRGTQEVASPFVTRFTYTSNVTAGTTGWTQASWSWPSGLPLVTANNDDEGVRIADVDGDGLPDLIKAFANLDACNPNQNGCSAQALTPTSGVYLNLGNGWSATKAGAPWELPVVVIGGNVKRDLGPFFAMKIADRNWGSGKVPIDVTGDGRVDLLQSTIFLNPNGEGGDDGVTMLDDKSSAAPLVMVDLEYTAPFWQSSENGWIETGPLPEPSEPLDYATHPAAREGSLGLLAFSGSSPITLGGTSRFGDLDGDGLPEWIVRGTRSVHNQANTQCIGGSFTATRAPVPTIAASHVMRNLGELTFELPPLTIGTLTIPASPGGQHPACASAPYISTPDWQLCDPHSDPECADHLFHSRAFLRRDTITGFTGTYWIVKRHLELGNEVLDVNADGLADAVSSYEISGDLVEAAYVNDGRRSFIRDDAWAPPRELYKIDNTDEYAKDLGGRFADVNGDGRVDFVVARSQPEGGNLRETYLNDGDAVDPTSETGVWRVAPAWAMPAVPGNFQNANGQDRGIRLIDVNGDGMVDVVEGRGSERRVFLNNGSVPDLLTGVQNPMGGTTTVEYTPSTAFDNTGTDAVPDLPAVVPVVSSIAVDDGNGVVSTTMFEYQDGRYDPAEREFRGFGQVTTIRSDQRATTTTFLQDEHNAGLISGFTTKDSAGAIIDAGAFGYTSDTDGPPFRVLPRQVIRADSYPRLSKTTYEYDGGGPIVHGNLTAVTEFGETTLFGSDVDATDNRTYELVYNPNSSSYLVDRIAVQRVREGSAPGAGTVVRETQLFYDGETGLMTPPTRGNLTKRIDVLGEAGKPDPTTTYGYDGYGNRTSITSPRFHAGQGGGTTTIEFDPQFHALPIAVVNPLGHRTEYSYAPDPACAGITPGAVSNHSPAAGLVHVERGPNELASTTTPPPRWLRCYDAFGRLVYEQAPGQLARLRRVHHDDPILGVRREDLRLVSPLQEARTVTFIDGLGRAYRIEGDGPQGETIVSDTFYDAMGRVEQETVPYFLGQGPGSSYVYEYDFLDRPKRKSLDGTQFVETFEYDAGWVTSTDANQKRQRRLVDTFGRVREVQELSSQGTTITTYEYDARDLLVSVVDDHENETLVGYDKLGLRRSIDDPDSGLTTFEYDANGNMIRRQDANLDFVEWSYDALDRPLTQRINGAATNDVAWTYDQAANGAGLLYRRSDRAGSYFAGSYDLLKRPLEERYVAGGFRHDFLTSYTKSGEIQSRNYPGSPRRTVTWVRDAKGYLTALRSGTQDYASGITWDAQGRLRSWTAENGVATTLTFTATHLETLTVANASGLLESLDYDYDAGDRVEDVNDLRAPSLGRTYEYDDRDRLIRAQGPFGAGQAQTNLYYRYDLIGNLDCKDAPAPIAPGSSAADCTNAGGKPLVYPAPGSGVVRPHAPTAVAGQSVVYDAAGNLRFLGAREYQYNDLGQLSAVKVGGATQASFTYDGTGRLAKIAGGSSPERFLLAPDFEWNKTGGVARIQVQLGGLTIATHEEPYTPAPSGGCGSVVPAAPALDGGPGALLGLLATMLATYLAWCAIWLVGRRPRGTRARAAVALALGVSVFAFTSVPTPLSPRAGAPAHASFPGSVVYYHADVLGSSLITTDQAGAVVSRASYKPYGEAAPGSSAIPEFGFTGQRLISSVGIYDYGARFYDPSLGRFLQPDALVPEPFDPQSLNRYSYVRNSPTNRIDPTGNFDIWGLWGGLTDFFGLFPSFFTDTLPGFFAEGSFLSENVFDPFYSTFLDPVLSAPGDIAAIWDPSWGAQPRQFADLDGGSAKPADTIDRIQATLGVLGAIPGVGAGPDLLNAGISALRGKWRDAGWSLAASVPVLGDLAAAGKVVRYGDEIVDAARAAAQMHRHHTVPREILKQLPDDVAKNPLVRGRAGAPNRWSIPKDVHESIHRGPGGGAYNEAFKQRLGELGRNPTVDDVLRIRDDLVKQFGLEGYRP